MTAFAFVSGLFLSAPTYALDMTDILIDTISAHPEIKESMHSYRRVVQDQVIANSGWRPSVDLNASTGLYEEDSPATNNQSNDYDSTSVELSLTQNLFSGYDTTYQQQQTKQRATAALFEIYDTADNIALRAIQAYLDVLKQRRLYQLALENVEAHEEILEQIRERDRSGVGRRSQLQQTEGRVARAYASLIAQQNNLEDAASQLHEILGRYVHPDDLVEPSLPDLPPEDLDDLIDRAIQNHPALRVANHNIRAAQADHKRSLKSRYPNIDLRLATEYGDDLNGLDGDSEETSIVLNLSYNLYDGGRSGAETQQKINTVYEQKEFAARVRRQIINTLRLAWVADTSIMRQLEFLELHIVKAAETAESYQEEFFIGQRDLLDLLDAKNELNNAKSQHAQAKFDGLTARYRVYESLGYLLQVSNVGFEIDMTRLNVGRLTTEKQDELPIPDDEDRDLEIDPTDHCDNTLPENTVNPYGCEQSGFEISELERPRQNSAPQLGDDIFQVEANGILVISAADLLSNDNDIDGDSIKIIDVGIPESGRLAYNENSELVYRPAEGFVGLDSFSYVATDEQDTTRQSKANVQIRVKRPEVVDLNKPHLVNFVYDEVELTKISKLKVEAIIDRIKATNNMSVEIFTFTDNIGSDWYNLELSHRRANALRDLLIANGIDADDIKAIGMGEVDPIADNSTLSGQAINRRGEIVFKPKN